MTTPTKWPVRPGKTQISLGICQVWSEPLQCAKWVAKDPMFLHADSEDADQTGRMLYLAHSHFVSFVVRRLSCLWLLWAQLCSTSFNPFMPSTVFYLSKLDQSIFNLRDVWSFFLLFLITFTPVITANSEGPIRQHILRQLIWVYNVCQGPIYGKERFGLVWFLFYGPSTHFRSFRVRSVNLATLFLGKPPRQFTST